jgi:hypothetical protein
MKAAIRRIPGLLLIFALALYAGCGYRIAGAVSNPPGGIRSLGIPTFANETREYKLEQQLTAAVLKEFALRTRIPITSQSRDVDAVLEGRILNLNSSPITFGADSFASAFNVTVDISVRLVRLKDRAVLWESQGFSYRAQYVLNSKVNQFFSEENAAVERLAKDFAASLASSILAR